MRAYFRWPPERRRYGQRWQVETVLSMIKRRLGDTLNARSCRRQNRAILLKVVTHNILILLLPAGFSTEHGCPYLSSLVIVIADTSKTWIHFIGIPSCPRVSVMKADFKAEEVYAAFFANNLTVKGIRLVRL